MRRIRTNYTQHFGHPNRPGEAACGARHEDAIEGYLAATPLRLTRSRAKTGCGRCRRTRVYRASTMPNPFADSLARIRSLF